MSVFDANYMILWGIMLELHGNTAREPSDCVSGNPAKVHNQVKGGGKTLY